MQSQVVGRDRFPNRRGQKPDLLPGDSPGGFTIRCLVVEPVLRAIGSRPHGQPGAGMRP